MFNCPEIKKTCDPKNFLRYIIYPIIDSYIHFSQINELDNPINPNRIFCNCQNIYSPYVSDQNNKNNKNNKQIYHYDNKTFNNSYAVVLLNTIECILAKF